jgi:hypothetical protein
MGVYRSWDARTFPNHNQLVCWDVSQRFSFSIRPANLQVDSGGTPKAKVKAAIVDREKNTLQISKCLTVNRTGTLSPGRILARNSINLRVGKHKSR